MHRIAITGNIACGKSQVEKILSDLGYIVYDSDIIAHEVLDRIENFCDYEVFTNGKIDRKKLGKLVFSNPTIKKQLENLTHPKIKAKILDIFEKHKNDKYVFISVPLLYEAKFNDIFDKVILITVNSEVQLNRLMQRNQLTKEEALLRINAQQPQEKKEKLADYIISNNSTIDELAARLQNIIKTL